MADNQDDLLVIDLTVPDPDKKPVEKKTTEAVEATDKAAAEVSVPDAAAFETLKKQLEDEKKGREQDRQRANNAEAAARKAAAAEAKSQTDSRTANLTMVTNAIDSVKREQEILEANYANAMSAGDFGAAAKIQTAIAKAATNLVQLETGRDAMEAEAKEAEKRPAPKVDFQTDPVEALASQLSPRSAQWVRAHPEFARDQRLMKKMVAAHNLVIDDVPADTDEYFEKVESILGIRKEAAAEAEESALSEAATTTQRRAAPPSAPVTRSGTGNGKRPGTVTLTAAEREIAEMNGMSPREYAEQKEKLIREGRMN